uniref:Uncharacterized protein n=1 Tax=Arundo donax TaxID=35708 RepID=A0A0A8XZE8_ARUDO
MGPTLFYAWAWHGYMLGNVRSEPEPIIGRKRFSKRHSTACTIPLSLLLKISFS